MFAYNHADWYVAEVLAKADAYRGAARAGAPEPPAGGERAAMLDNPRIMLDADPARRCALGRDRPAAARGARVDRPAARGRHHGAEVRPLALHRRRHVSNHSAGRAMDIGAVDGEVCRGTRTGRCADLVRELAAVTGPLRSTELIYCWDPDGPADPRGFARADHCDHIHWGMDA